MNKIRKRLIRHRPASEIHLEKLIRATYPRARIEIQAEIGPFFADLCINFNGFTVAIEVDGPYHVGIKRHRLDIERTEFLNKHGHSVIHMTDDVAWQIDSIELKALISKSLATCCDIWITPRDLEHAIDPAEQFSRF